MNPIPLRKDFDLLSMYWEQRMTEMDRAKNIMQRHVRDEDIPDVDTAYNNLIEAKRQLTECLSYEAWLMLAYHLCMFHEALLLEHDCGSER